MQCPSGDQQGGGVVLCDDGLPRVSARVVPKQDFAKFELIREGDSWLITKGI